MSSDADLLALLAQSPTFSEYQRAFSEATGFPLSLRPIEAWKPALAKSATETRFCAMIASQSRTCAGCLRMQEQLCEGAKTQAATLQCPFGLTEVAVPIRLGDKTIGFLVSGQVLHRQPSPKDLRQMVAHVESLGVKMDTAKLERAFMQIRVVPESTLASATRLLTIFAEHLALVSNAIMVRNANAEPAMVTRVKDFVAANYERDITLEEVARAAHSSTFHLCKVLKKSTGLCFTELLSRTRVEKAKALLHNRNLRISEIAFQVGFQSLTHFNRVFRKIVGESPSDYRGSHSFALAA
jgi:AraC-like DNA-binding protein/ligand-binding sensor protein